MTNIELALLSKMTNPEGMAKVIEENLGPEVFLDPRCRALFDFALKYREKSGETPTVGVLNDEMPARNQVPEPGDVEEATHWLIEKLQKRHVFNKLQDATIDALSKNDPSTDPIGAAQALGASIGKILDEVGKAGMGFDDEFLFGDQLDDLPKAEPLIEGVITRYSYSVLRGRDHTFKSFIALDWALCLAAGVPWQGRKTEQVKVLYVIGEGAYGLASRKRAWESARKVSVDPKWFVVRKSAVNLYKTGAAFDHMLARIKDEGYGLVVFDTLRWMSSGADANGSDMAIVVDNLDRVRWATDRGAVQLVAHTDKGDNDTRGFSGIEDDSDIVWSTDREAGTREVTLSNHKMKDGPSGHRIALRMKGEGDSLVVVGADLSLAEQIQGEFRDTDRRVMEAMREQFSTTGAMVKDLVTATGLSQSAVYSSLKRLVGPGEPLRRDGKSRVWLVEPARGDSEHPQTHQSGGDCHIGKPQVGAVENNADSTEIPRHIPSDSTVKESSGPASFHGFHDVPRGFHEDSTIRGGLVEDPRKENVEKGMEISHTSLAVLPCLLGSPKATDLGSVNGDNFPGSAEGGKKDSVADRFDGLRKRFLPNEDVMAVSR